MRSTDADVAGRQNNFSESGFMSEYFFITISLRAVASALNSTPLIVSI